MSRRKIRVVEKRKDQIRRLQGLVRQLEGYRDSLDANIERKSKPVFVEVGPTIQCLQESEYSLVSDFSIEDVFLQIGGFYENNECSEGREGDLSTDSWG